MMEPAKDRNRCDAADPLRPAEFRSIFAQRDMRPDFVVIRSVVFQDVAKVRFAEHHEWSSDSRRIDPISRSTCPFCHGDRASIG